MGLLTGLIRDRLSELAIAPEEIAARRKRWEREMYSPGSSGAVLTYTPTPAQNTPGQQSNTGTGVGGTGTPTRLPPGSSYSSIAIQTMRDGGWSDAAIKSALAAGIGEGGFGQQWARSSIPGEQSFGHWQLNAGGRLPDYQKFAGNATDTATQTKFMMNTMEKLHPGFSKIDDPTVGVQLFHDKFKDYGASPSNLPGAESLLNQHNQAMQNAESTATASSTGSSSSASLARYATGNAKLGGASSVEGVHPEFANRISNMVQAMPPDIAAKFNIISGVRSPERQSQVNPGVTNSHHAPGLAVDTTWDSGVRNWITQNGNRFGVGYTLANMPNEGNHLEPTENGQRVQPSQMKQWAQAHMSSPSSSTQTASNSSGSGGIGSAISGALSSIGNAIMPSAHADTLPQPPTSAPATANQQTAAAPSTQSPPTQSPPPQQPPSQPPVASVQPVTSSPQMALAIPPDKIPQLEGLVRPAIYLMRRTK